MIPNRRYSASSILRPYPSIPRWVPAANGALEGLEALTHQEGRNDDSYSPLRMRSGLGVLVVMCLFCTAALGQEVTPIKLSGTYPAAPNSLTWGQVRQAWQATWGKSPRAALLMEDSVSGVLESKAQFNYRSTLLLEREETMGAVAYRLLIHMLPTGVAWSVGQLHHTGNHKARGGGVHIGPLSQAEAPPQALIRVSRSNAKRIWDDVRHQSEDHLRALAKAFEDELAKRAGTPQP
jgi:hypothetical protein